MASASKATREVPKTITEKVPVIRLELTTKEAEALHLVLRNVGGDRAAGREHIDTVLKALDPLTPSYGTGFKTSGSIYFNRPAKYPSIYDVDSLLSSNPFKL